ncbi:hypothetical protein N658DRAFT_241282 [Parathielavia hyrcaniae]|uniref:Uncharacterized protein n=1 Tax=Parathielavia hyrcaniae TaxID=113614 RepID=A0AAN6Q703_9PEZI|nr:hypothetical protein N658DRAFT_241282 [Parathielavia hyrcaniae]
MCWYEHCLLSPHAEARRYVPQIHRSLGGHLAQDSSVRLSNQRGEGTRRGGECEIYRVRWSRDFYSVLQGISPTAARLTRRILVWLMDSGRLPMYNLARRLELELAV